MTCPAHTALQERLTLLLLLVLLLGHSEIALRHLLWCESWGRASCIRQVRVSSLESTLRMLRRQVLLMLLLLHGVQTTNECTLSTLLWIHLGRRAASERSLWHKVALISRRITLKGVLLLHSILRRLLGVLLWHVVRRGYPLTRITLRWHALLLYLLTLELGLLVRLRGIALRVRLQGW